MTQSLMQAYTSGGGAKQLIARNSDLRTRPVTLDNAINAAVARGCLLYGATPEAALVKVVHTTAQPAATDMLFIAADDIDLTGAAADVKANAFVSGEFVAEAVWAATDATLSDAEKLAILEIMLRQGINLVKASNADVTDSVYVA